MKIREKFKSKKGQSIKKELSKKMIAFFVIFQLGLFVILYFVIQFSKYMVTIIDFGLIASRQLITEDYIKEGAKKYSKEVNAIFSLQISGKLDKIADNTLIISNVIKDCYINKTNNSENISATLAPGVDWESCKQEYGWLSELTEKSGIDIESNLHEIHGLLKYTYVSNSGMSIDLAKQDGNITYAADDERNSKLYTDVKNERIAKWENSDTSIRYAIPVIQDGDFKGVLFAILDKENLAILLKNSSESLSGNYCIFDNDGVVIYKSDSSVNYNDNVEDVELIDNMVISLGEIQETGWKVKLYIPIKNLEQIISQIDEGNDLLEYDISEKLFRVIFETIYIAICILIIICMVIAFLVLNRTIKKFTKPIEQFTESAEEIGNGNFDKKITMDSYDELEKLSESFNKMQIKIKEHINDIEQMAAKEEKLNTQINIINQIKQQMHAEKTETFYNQSMIDIAVRENNSVTNIHTFNDYYFVDDEHFCIVIGETKSTGIPSLMLSTIIRSHIKCFATIGYNPARILEETNNILCTEENIEMNVSVFVAIVNVNTGNMIYSQASQKGIYLKHADSEFINITENDQKIPLAVMEDVSYKSKQIKLLQGDTLVMYTDDTIGQLDDKGNIYMVEDLLEDINKAMKRNVKLELIIDDVIKSRNEFKNTNEKTDENDSTLILLRYIG